MVWGGGGRPGWGGAVGLLFIGMDSYDDGSKVVDGNLDGEGWCVGRGGGRESTLFSPDLYVWGGAGCDGVLYVGMNNYSNGSLVGGQQLDGKGSRCVRRGRGASCPSTWTTNIMAARWWTATSTVRGGGPHEGGAEVTVCLLTRVCAIHSNMPTAGSIYASNSSSSQPVGHRMPKAAAA